MRQTNKTSLSGLFLLLFMAGMLFAGGVLAADDITARALKLYEKHRYEEAVHLLRPELAGMDGSRQAAASLALGMICLGNAKMYRELQQAAQVAELDYLMQLGGQKSGIASRYVNLYLGQILVETGQPDKGVRYLQRFTEQSGHELDTIFARIELGIAYSRQKQAQKALQAWSNLDMGKPEIRAALAGAYAVAGAQQHKPVAMADAVLGEVRKQRHIPGARMLRNLLRAYSHSGETEKALDLLMENDFNAASHIEELGASKSISFYDFSLLGDMARTHLLAAVKYLEQAGKDEKVASAANYFLADAYLQQGNAEAALQLLSGVLQQDKIPQQYRDVARVFQAAAQFRAGQHARAVATWQSMAESAGQDAALQAEVLLSCVLAGADCRKLEKLALASIESGEGKKLFPLNVALGKYYSRQKDYSKALQYMEAGRDKANKNKIEANDPVMLVALAETYYRNKNFSENLEIYFEIGKQYPVVRQIQEAMQGIYSMEHRSAGDVKIF